MEWKEILIYGVFAGLMLLMMKLGGCCGGRNHKKDSHESDGGCREKDADNKSFQGK